MRKAPTPINLNVRPRFHFELVGPAIYRATYQGEYVAHIVSRADGRHWYTYVADRPAGGPYTTRYDAAMGGVSYQYGILDCGQEELPPDPR